MPDRETAPAGSPGVKLTYDDLVLLPDDGKRHELIDGEHYVLPSPGRSHQTVVGNVYFHLRAHLATHPGGWLYVAPFDVFLSEFDVVEPDLLYVGRDRRRILTERFVRGAPDLAVEVGSPATRRRDEKQKLALYERHGVAEYWVVDPEIETIKVYRLADGRYGRAAELALDRGDVLTTPLLPGFSLALASVFDEAHGNG